MRRFSLVAATLLVGAVSLSAPASAVVVTFATYNQVGSGANLRWVRAPGGVGGQLFTISSPNSGSAGAVRVNFSFLQPVLAALGQIAADFSLNSVVASNNAAQQIGPFVAQDGLNGSFSFTSIAPFQIGQTFYAAGANLLSGSFTNALMVGGSGGTAGVASASEGAGSIISFTSDFLNFSGPNHNFAISLNSITQALFANPGKSLNGFKTSSNGAFSADPATLTATIPEPAGWALMIGGFALVGIGLRRRRATMVSA